MRIPFMLFFMLVSGFNIAAENQNPTITITPQNVPEWFEMDAKIEPVNQGTVSAQTSGRVSAIGVDVNDVVPAGHLLIEITNASQTAGLDQAKAAVKAAEARLIDADRQRQRMANLIKTGSIAKREYDAAVTESESATSALKQAKAEVVQASENLGYTRVVSPYAGVVSGKMVSLGETVNPGQALLSGYAFEHMRVVASLPVRYADILKDNTPLKVTFNNGQSLLLSEHQLFQFADPTNHSFTLRANLPKQDSPIWKNGVWVKLAMPLTETPKLLVPENAVLRQNELSAVYLKTSEQFVLRQVRLGHMTDGKVEILSGLKAGDQIAADAYTVLSQQGGHYAP